MLIAALRKGDEDAFAYLVERYHGQLVRMATLFCRDASAAEEVAQETWIAVLQGVGRFEGRSSLKTWIFSILSNKAKTRGQRESRSIAFSELESGVGESDEPVVDPERFKPDGWWRDDSHPTDWESSPELIALTGEIQSCINAALTHLPSQQAQVMTMRDILGLDSADVCNVLGISETNQRVLLHRARSKVRIALERYFDER